MAYVRFAMHERAELLRLLEMFQQETARGDFSLSTFCDVAAFLLQVIPSADLVVQSQSLAFTAAHDHKRYFASGAGLWRLSDQSEDVTAKEWWLAVLRTRAHFANSRLEAAA